MLGHHMGGKWLIHDWNHRKEEQFARPEKLPPMIFYIEC